MNEKKIQALAEQANLGPCCESQAVAIKELIANECIDIVAAGGEFASRPKLVEQLKEHFGVGEE
jgi:2,4-dienoyl-CoA reductase-like NADH-dependent reductase (Old Yellow Enzyme family)